MTKLALFIFEFCKTQPNSQSQRNLKLWISAPLKLFAGMLCGNICSLGYLLTYIDTWTPWGSQVYFLKGVPADAKCFSYLDDIGLEGVFL